jgi:SAM-dependent methyltransferase
MFEAQAEGYRNLADHLVRVARAHLGAQEHIRLLQIGCAVEDAVMYFPYGQRFAIDPLAQFYVRHFERSRNPQVTYFPAVGEAIPFAAGTFHVAICNNVLDHMLHPEKLLGEVRRTLRPGGLFYLSVDVYPREASLERGAREAQGEVVDPCHPHSFTTESLTELAAAAGFQTFTAWERPSGKADGSIRYCMTLIQGGYPHPSAEAMRPEGLTAGPTGRLDSCPAGGVNRGQTASLILEAMGEAPSAPYRGYFADVPAEYSGSPSIERIYELGITAGRRLEESARYFCPERLITRGEIAVFLARAADGGDPSGGPNAATFADVPPDHPFFKWIERLSELGATSGCYRVGADKYYCPSSPVSRAELDAFLSRLFPSAPATSA